MRAVRAIRLFLWVQIAAHLFLIPVYAETFTPLTRPYHVVFEGLEGTGLEPLFRQVSDTWNYRQEPPPTAALLRMRMQSDATKFRKVLMSRGYFNAAIQNTLSGDSDNLTATVRVTLNRPFTFGRVDVIFTNLTEKGLLPSIPSSEELGLKEGERATYRRITEGKDALLAAVRRDGFAFAELVSQNVIVDYADERVRVRWVLEPGCRAVFGSLDVIGLKRVKRSLIRKMTTWKKGAVYNPLKVEAFQNLLAGSGLFSISILSMKAVGEPVEDTVDFVLEVTERPRRSVGFGVGYNTERGAGVFLNWEDRNLFGAAECLHLEAAIEEKKRQGEVSYAIPHFFHRSVGLKAFSRLGDEHPPAYESTYWKNQAGMSWDVTPNVHLACAYALKAAQVTQFDQTDDFYLQSCPLSLRWDYRNDRIEPTTGGVVFVEAEYLTEWNRQDRFLRERFRWRQVVRVWSHPQITLSGNCGVGLIQGGDVFDIPADERFYAGGSDTIRGYAYQMAGPLLEDEPTGGCSMLTLSGEVCVKVYGPIGLVGFLDAGNVFAESVPSRDDELLWGAGGGLRVFSPVGAIGLELGFPLNRRSVDDSFQFYITIGFQF